MLGIQDRSVVIDPTVYGNEVRFSNHRLDPNDRFYILRLHNAILRVVFVYAMRAIAPGKEVTVYDLFYTLHLPHQMFGVVFVYELKDIEPGDEITVDYGWVAQDGMLSLVCACVAPTCRTLVGLWRSMSPVTTPGAFYTRPNGLPNFDRPRLSM